MLTPRGEAGRYGYPQDGDEDDSRMITPLKKSGEKSSTLRYFDKGIQLGMASRARDEVLKMLLNVF